MRKESLTTKPRVSVIIPVYNKAGCLEECIAALAKQRCKPGIFEAILVDDGSTDDSLQKSHELAARHSFIRVYSQENQGVSGARNTGMAHAEGDYLLFLDSDDSITDTTIGNVVEAFDSFGDETDVLSYPLEYHFARTGKSRRHEREEWLVKTGLYPLDEYPFVAQTTMNVCVRNRRSENIQFDKSLKMGEDQLFITKNLERKGTLGFCREALYRYVREEGTASSRNNNPLYAFEDMITLYTYLEDLADRNKKMARYCHHMVLHNFGWRLTSSMLFPTYCKGEERVRQERRLADIAKRIPACEYAQSPYLLEYHKAGLMKLYGKISESPVIRYESDATKVELSDGTVWETNLPQLCFERMRCENGVLRMMARLICPVFTVEEEPELFLTVAGERKKVELGDSSFGYARSRYLLNRAWSLCVDVPIEPSSKQDIMLAMTASGQTTRSVEVETKPAVHNARRIKDVLYFADVTVAGERGKIVLDSRSVNPYSSKLAVHSIANPRFEARRLVMWRHVRKSFGKHIWLYSDLPTSPSEGNALLQILHDLQMNDGVERYYVSNFGKELEQKHPELEGRVVALRSRDHQFLTFEAELILSSYLERFIRIPLKQKTYNELGDLGRNQRLVYLQHGILHAHMPWYFSFDRIAFDYEVVSTEFEMNNLMENYCFPRKALIPSGAPRLDTLKKRESASRRAVFVPSWRTYLVTGTAAQRIPLDSTFLNSAVYLGMQAFFKAITENGVLDRNDWMLDVKLHPNFECYKHLFTFTDPRIRLIGEEIDPSDYDLVITDYSSYVYDFVYAGAGVVYFLPDHAEFSAGLNHYSQLDWPLEDALGSYCETPEEACEAVRSFIEGDVDAAREEAYDKRKRGLFLHSDGKNRKRLYKALQEITDELNRAEG